MSDKPVGKPFSHVYVERGAAVEHNARFRNRLRAYLRDLPDGYLGAIANLISKETGAHVYYGDIAKHFTECSLLDLLDNITHAFNALKTVSQSHPRPHVIWYGFVERSLKKENLAYALDAQCGVDPAFDEEFDVARRATIAALGLPRYSTARDFFDQSIADLKPPQDTRDAVRKAFEAVENVARLMVPQIALLGAAEVEKTSSRWRPKSCRARNVPQQIKC